MKNKEDLVVLSTSKNTINSWTRRVSFSYLGKPYVVQFSWDDEFGYGWYAEEGSIAELRADFLAQEGPNEDLTDFFVEIDERTSVEAYKP